MWFNSTQREEPYQALTLIARDRDVPFLFGGQENRWCGCRQLSCRELIKSRNERNPYLLLPAVRPGTQERLPQTMRRKAGMTSSHHAPYGLGYTRTTMALNRGRRRSDPEQTPKTESQFGLQAATRLHEAGIASNRRSAYCGEYVPGPCTHRPSHHESHSHPKPVR